MSRARWVAVAGLPVLVCAIVLAFETGLGNWAALPRPVLFGALVDTLLLNTLLVIVAAPIAGVVLGTTGRAANGVLTDAEGCSRVARGAPGVVAPLATMAVAFAAGSALVCVAGWGSSGEAPRAIAASHVTLAAAALALAALGALCGLLFRHPLDAAACSLAVSLLASGAVVLGGPSLADAPRPLVAAGLLASPLVTTASAAGIDLFRTDVLYQVSPLAHIRLDYPAWQAAAALYLFVALSCFGIVVCGVRSRSDPRTH